MDRLWLIALLVLWGVLLFGGFLFGHLDPERIRRMPAWTRMASSLALVIAAWSAYIFARETEAGSYALLIALGMSFGFIGDLLMARWLSLKNHVIGGIAAFGLGHIAYIAALVSYGNQAGLDARAPRWGALAVWLVAGVIGWYVVVLRNHKPTLLHRAALPYTLLLSSTAGFAAGLALQSSAFMPLALGAALFLLSDLILAARLFNNLRFYLIDDVVWLLYGPAQMLIVYSVGSALAA